MHLTSQGLRSLGLLGGLLAVKILFLLHVIETIESTCGEVQRLLGLGVGSKLWSAQVPTS